MIMNYLTSYNNIHALLHGLFHSSFLYSWSKPRVRSMLKCF